MQVPGVTPRRGGEHIKPDTKLHGEREGGRAQEGTYGGECLLVLAAVNVVGNACSSWLQSMARGMYSTALDAQPTLIPLSVPSRVGIICGSPVSV